MRVLFISKIIEINKIDILGGALHSYLYMYYYFLTQRSLLSENDIYK